MNLDAPVFTIYGNVLTRLEARIIRFNGHIFKICFVFFSFVMEKAHSSQNNVGRFEM